MIYILLLIRSSDFKAYLEINFDCIFTGMKITGKVVFLSFEGGAYGIIDKNGRKFLPINMPNQLKKDGAEVICSVRPAEVVSTIMWGEPVYIYSFETL